MFYMMGVETTAFTAFGNMLTVREWKRKYVSLVHICFLVWLAPDFDPLRSLVRMFLGTACAHNGDST